MKKVVKVQGKKIKSYKRCQIWLNNGVFDVHYKGEIFPCPSMEFAIKLIDTWKP